MNGKLSNVIKKSKQYLGKHSPEILTGLGITGMITTTILAVKATPKALQLIEIRNQEELRKNEDFIRLGAWETVKTAWKPYIPAASLCVASTACLIGASAVNAKRNAALATAYAISERTLVRYRDKVIETIGEKKEKEIKEKISQDEVNNKKISDTQVIITGKAVNEINRQMTYQHYVSLNDFYYELGLDGIKTGSLLGWNLDDGLVKLDHSACLAEDGTPCHYIDFEVLPKYDYDKFM